MRYPGIHLSVVDNPDTVPCQRRNCTRPYSILLCLELPPPDAHTHSTVALRLCHQHAMNNALYYFFHSNPWDPSLYENPQ